MVGDGKKEREGKQRPAGHQGSIIVWSERASGSVCSGGICLCGLTHINFRLNLENSHLGNASLGLRNLSTA